MSEPTMQGRRIANPFEASGALIADWPAAGDYWRNDEQGWFGCAPDGAMAGLGKHDVVEHEDGTITVSPSILVSGGGESWHGYLERGVWRTC